MLDFIYNIALLWSALLAATLVWIMARSRSFLNRILALDVLSLVIISMLALLAYRNNAVWYLDAALTLALLAFIGTLAAARYHRQRGPT